MDSGNDSNNRAQRIFDEAVNQSFDPDSTDLSICLASAKDRATPPEFQNVEVTETLGNKFREIIRTFCRKQREDQKTVNEYSIDQKPGDHFVQFVDLEDYPEARDHVDPLLSPGSLAPFRNEERIVKNLRFYAIVAQVGDDQTIVALRSITRAQKPHRGKWTVRAIFNEDLNRYEDMTEDLFLFDEEIDCLLYNNHVFISNRDKFEAIFNFHQVRRDVAERALVVIERDLRIHNFEEFREACLRDPRKQGRLARIANGTDLSLFTVAKAREVIQANPQLESIIGTEGSEETLAYDPQNKWDLLRFLSETTVSSLVTGNNFETDDKRPLSQ